MELRFLVGYKFDSDDASNGEVTWDTIPFTALALLKSNNWRVGGGVTYHLNPELSGGFSGDNVSSEEGQYNSAFGAVAQIQYMATDAFSIGIKGTLIEYELKSDPSYKARGNSVGFVATYTFGNRSEFR
jgi:long-subunit fatty acid transport protein